MSILVKNQGTGGLEPGVVSALAQLFVAGQRAQDGHMPHFLTANGVKVAIEPSAEHVTVSFQQASFQLAPNEAYELATMMTAAADGLRQIAADGKTIPLPSGRPRPMLAADALQSS